jgi:hypothetical protein
VLAPFNWHGGEYMSLSRVYQRSKTIRDTFHAMPIALISLTTHVKLAALPCETHNENVYDSRATTHLKLSRQPSTLPSSYSAVLVLSQINLTRTPCRARCFKITKLHTIFLSRVYLHSKTFSTTAHAPKPFIPITYDGEKTNMSSHMIPAL